MSITNLNPSLSYVAERSACGFVVLHDQIEGELMEQARLTPSQARTLAEELDAAPPGFSRTNARVLADSLMVCAILAETMEPLSDSELAVFECLQVIDSTSMGYIEHVNQQFVIRVGFMAIHDLITKTGFTGREVRTALGGLHRRELIKDIEVAPGAAQKFRLLGLT